MHVAVKVRTIRALNIVDCGAIIFGSPDVVRMIEFSYATQL